MKDNLLKIAGQYSKHNFFISAIEKTELPAGSRHTIDPASTGHCSFIISSSGFAETELQGESCRINPGKVYHISNSQAVPCRIDSTGAWKFYRISYSCSNEACRNSDLFNKYYTVQLTDYQAGQLQSITAELWKNSRRSGSLSQLKQKSLFYLLLDKIFLYSDTEIPCRTVMEYIDSNIHNKIQVEEMAEIFKTDAKTLSYNFKREYGLSPRQYITSTRVKLAKQLIARGGYRISEISERVGFDDALYFSRAFKKHVGKSPKAYADSLK